jgi:hypothetical protein
MKTLGMATRWYSNPRAVPAFPRPGLVFCFSRHFGVSSHTNRGMFVPSISQEK